MTAVRGDIRDPRAVDEAMAGVDLVVHTAAALPLYSPDDIYTTDVDGTRVVLEAALRHGVQRAVHISSTAVYGIPDHHPLLENDRLEGVGPYGQAKIQAEMVALELRAKGLVVSILRPKSFIGPERLGVFALLYDWAIDGKNFPVLGSGNNLYQYLDVSDLCDAILLCLTLPTEQVNDTFNVGAKEFAHRARGLPGRARRGRPRQEGHTGASHAGDLDAAGPGQVPPVAALQMGLRDGHAGLVRVDREGRATVRLRAASTPISRRCCATSNGTPRTAPTSPPPPASPIARPGSKGRSGWSKRCSDSRPQVDRCYQPRFGTLLTFRSARHQLIDAHVPSGIASLHRKIVHAGSQQATGSESLRQHRPPP